MLQASSLSPKEPLFATASADKTVRLWDADTLAGGKTLTGLTDYVYAVAFSPDGTLVAGGGYDGEVRVWKVADGEGGEGVQRLAGVRPAGPGEAGEEVRRRATPGNPRLKSWA